MFVAAKENFVSVTGTLQSGTSTTRLWSDSSRATQTGPAALIFLLTAPSSGLGAWTTLSGHGTSGREDSSSNTTSAVRSSVWAGVPLETGWLWEWRTATLRFSTPLSQTSTSSIYTRVVFSASSSPTAASGLSPLAKTISSMPGGHPTEHPYSSLRRPLRC